MCLAVAAVDVPYTVVEGLLGCGDAAPFAGAVDCVATCKRARQLQSLKTMSKFLFCILPYEELLVCSNTVLKLFCPTHWG